MRQFDVVRLTGRELAVLLQSDLLEERRTRVAAPLFPRKKIKATPHLHPIVRIGRRDYVLAMEKLSAIEVSEVESVIGTAAPLEYEIRRALDMVFMGV
jgi:hypothetical protein